MTDQELSLNKEWTLRFDTPFLHKCYKDYIDTPTWKQSIHEIYRISNIPDFWKTYNNVVSPEDLWYKSAYYLFAGDTAPCYSDTDDRYGCKIHFAVPNGAHLNDAWLHTILPFLGESIEYSEYVNGAIFIKHKNYSEIVLWVSVTDKAINDYFIGYFLDAYKKKDIEIYNYYLSSMGPNPTILTQTAETVAVEEEVKK